jgi:hypothetical protein
MVEEQFEDRFSGPLFNFRIIRTSETMWLLAKYRRYTHHCRARALE